MKNKLTIYKERIERLFRKEPIHMPKSKDFKVTEMKQACIYMITNTANGLSTVINKKVRAKQKELSVLRKKEESKQRSIEINRMVASALLDQDIAAFKTKHGITKYITVR